MFEVVEYLHPIYKEAEDLLKLHGLWQQGWRFELRSSKRRVGGCHYNDKLITYSEHFLKEKPELITDVLLHEIAHALVTWEDGHNHVWRAKCREIGANPNRLVEVDEQPEFNWRIYCPECGREWYRYRLKLDMDRAICPRCRCSLEAENLM